MEGEAFSYKDIETNSTKDKNCACAASSNSSLLKVGKEDKTEILLKVQKRKTPDNEEKEEQLPASKKTLIEPKFVQRQSPRLNSV